MERPFCGAVGTVVPETKGRVGFTDLVLAELQSRMAGDASRIREAMAVRECRKSLAALDLRAPLTKNPTRASASRTDA